MTKITDNTTLKNFIEKKLKSEKTILDKEVTKTKLIHIFAKVSGLSPETITQNIKQTRNTIAANRYALMQAAIERGEI